MDLVVTKLPVNGSMCVCLCFMMILGVLLSPPPGFGPGLPRTLTGGVEGSASLSRSLILVTFVMDRLLPSGDTERVRSESE